MTSSLIARHVLACNTDMVVALQVWLYAAQSGILDILAGCAAAVVGGASLWLPSASLPDQSRAGVKDPKEQLWQALLVARTQELPLECLLRSSPISRRVPKRLTNDATGSNRQAESMPQLMRWGTYP